jgi:hypothetical protein
MSITSFGIGLAVFLVGWFVGFLDSNLRTSKKIKAAEQKSELAVREAEDKIAQAEQKAMLASQAVQNTAKDDPGLLRLKNDNGRYVLEMDGTPLPESLAPDKRKRLIDIITIIRPWIEGKQISQPAPSAPASLPTPPQPAPVQSSISRPVTAAPKAPEAEKPLASMSIVGQIDSILQVNLAKSPYAKSGVRLQESIQGGVEVYVGLQKFDTVEDVSDPAIKAIIRASISEWENKYTPGL